MRSSGSGSGEKHRNFERYDYSRGIGYWYFTKADIRNDHEMYYHRNDKLGTYVSYCM